MPLLGSAGAALVSAEDQRSGAGKRSAHPMSVWLERSLVPSEVTEREREHAHEHDDLLEARDKEATMLYLAIKATREDLEQAGQNQNTKPAPSGAKSTSLTRKLGNLFLRQNKHTSPGAEKKTRRPKLLPNTNSPSASQVAAAQTSKIVDFAYPRSTVPSPTPSPGSLPVVKTVPAPHRASSTPSKSSKKPEVPFTVDNILDMLQKVNFCKDNGGGEAAEQLAFMIRRSELAGTQFPLGYLDDACYRWQPSETPCAPQSMVDNYDNEYYHIWDHLCTYIIRVQWFNRQYVDCSDADAFTCYQLGDIWTSEQDNPREAQELMNQGKKSVSFWRDSHFKLMVEIVEAKSETGEFTGRPTGPVWVVNYTGCRREHAQENAKTKLERVQVARVADSLQELINCKGKMWPKFEDRGAHHLEWYPCYQEVESGPILRLPFAGFESCG
ncbi:hypothetical protein PG988_003479 [Apiospora saccharicola]